MLRETSCATTKVLSELVLSVTSRKFGTPVSPSNTINYFSVHLGEELVEKGQSIRIDVGKDSAMHVGLQASISARRTTA